MKRKFEFDEETAECPLCNEFLSPPIHQCKNGHMACAPCCVKLKGKECPTCRANPFAHSRNLGLEKMIESLQTTCVHAPEGCKVMVKLSEGEKHAKERCEFRQLKCPKRACNHKGPRRGIPDHFKSVHNGATVQLTPGTRSGEISFKSWNEVRQYVLFTADTELFLVQIYAQDLCSVNMLSCSSFGNSLKYNLKATVKSKEGVFSASAETLALNNQVKMWKKINLIQVPHVSQTAEIVLQLTLL